MRWNHPYIQFFVCLQMFCPDPTGEVFRSPDATLLLRFVVCNGELPTEPNIFVIYRRLKKKPTLTLCL